MQLGIFGNDKPEIEKEQIIDWSHSKREVLNQCTRKYYYQYYGSNKRSAIGDPDKEELAFQKGLSNKYLLQGEIIHKVIATFFKKSKGGSHWDYYRLKSWALKLLDDTMHYGENYRKGQREKLKYPLPLLKEIIYEEQPLKELRQEIEEKIIQNLYNFFYSEQFSFLRTGGISSNSILEGKAIFKLTDLIRIDGVIDISFSKESNFVIADWKTGKIAVEDTSLQLLSYALWAIDKKYASADNIIIYKAYLMEDKLDVLEFSSKHLLRAKSRVIQDVEKMRELADFGKEGIYEAFTKCDKENVCNLCPFQRVCINH